MTRPDTPQPLSVIEAVIPVAALILLVALTYYLFGDAGSLGPNQVALALVNISWLIITALAFAGVVEKAGVLDKVIASIIVRAKSDGAPVLSLATSSFATTVITADQVIAIMLPGRMFKNMFEDCGLAPARLCRPKH